MDEGVLDIQLVHRSAPLKGQSQHNADGGMLHHEAESIIVVHIGELGEPPEDPTCLTDPEYHPL
jgi:hypothetical protein